MADISKIKAKNKDGVVELYDIKDETARARIEEVAANGGNGVIGEDGKSAYQIWLDQGNSGTEQDFLNSLKGADGKDGTNGVDGKDGQDGQNGKDGENGVSATHSWNGTTLTITSASGSSSADLKGEKGDKGDQGIQGEKGKDGTGVTILGSYDTESALKSAHPTGTAGDSYLVEGDLYVWSQTENAWKNVGNIKGEKGDKGDKGDTGAAGTNGVSATHSWNGTTLTITSASGSSSVDLKGEKGDKGEQGIQGVQGEQGIQGEQGVQGEKGEKGDTGAKGDTGLQGEKGADGIGISSITQTTTSSVDGGTNILTITKTDGSAATFSVKNGTKGSDGAKGTDGYTPVKGTDYWTEADKTEIKNYVASDVIDKLTLGINPADGLVYIYKDGEAIGSGIEISGGASIGYVDVATNTIIINTSLGEGTYVVQYETEEGDPIYIGELEIDNSVRYTVTNNLTKCSTNNSVAQVIGGESYTAVISPDTGHIVETITVLMGGNDITSTAVEGNTISIASVDGAIEITAVAVEQVVSNNRTITNNLTNCSNSNTTTEVVNGNSYSATISTTPAYALSTLKVLMGGTDISSSAIAKTTTGATISISSVTENVTITATAVENLIAKSTNADGTIFNTTGYQSGMSQSSSSGAVSAQSGYTVSGFMDVVANQTIRIKNIDVANTNSRNNIVFYNASYSRVASATLNGMFTNGGTDEGNGIYSRELTGFTTELATNLANIAYMRFSSTQLDSTSVVVVDETII